ncbi:MAG: pantoate--beta-alanine ligase [Alphaproteobacteria bacterium]
MALDLNANCLPTARTVADLRDQVKVWRADGLRIALVPTMGALHIGHMSLIEEAKKHADKVIVSIFVNPTQFAPHEDFDAYPRTEKTDSELVKDHGGHLIYAPSGTEMYPDGFSTSINITGITNGLCGDSRPHFFGGVAIVVSKLLLQALPDVAIFGEKDYQQLQVIKRMVADLNIPVEVVGAPLVRDEDGLATSSRNKYLTAQDRQQGLALHKALANVATLVKNGKTAADALKASEAILNDAEITSWDYFEVRDASDLTLVDGPVTRPARAFIATQVGKARLIDNWPIDPA